jgi:hypothetical protein
MVDPFGILMDLLELQRYAGGQLPGWNGMAALEAWLADPAGGAEVMQVLVAAGAAHGGNDTLLKSTGNDKSRRWRDGDSVWRQAVNEAK